MSDAHVTPGLARLWLVFLPNLEDEGAFGPLVSHFDKCRALL